MTRTLGCKDLYSPTPSMENGGRNEVKEEIQSDGIAKVEIRKGEPIPTPEMGTGIVIKLSGNLLVPPPPSSGRSSSYTPTRLPQHGSTPLEDVGSMGWDRPPTNSTRHAQHGIWPTVGNHTYDGAVVCPTPLVQPQQRRQRQRAHDMYIQGERARIAADAMRLWGRLDKDIPSGPRNPEGGFGEEALLVARRGRDRTRFSMERGQASAQANWRSVIRPSRYNGGIEEELYNEYTQAVRNYIMRYDRRMQ